MNCTFYIARRSSVCTPCFAQNIAAQSTAAPAPTATTTFYGGFVAPAEATISVDNSTIVPTTSTSFFVKNEIQTPNTKHADSTEETVAPKLKTSWASYAGTSSAKVSAACLPATLGAAFSPAWSQVPLADITYETVQRQYERIWSFEVNEFCDGEKARVRAPSTLDQPAPPKDMTDIGKGTNVSSGAVRQVRVQEAVPDYMRSPSASILPPPNWSPELIRGVYNDGGEKDYVPELMYAPSPSSFPAPNWGPEPDWFADFPAPTSPFSSGSSASSVRSCNVQIVGPRPRRAQKTLTAEIAHLEAEAAVMVAVQEAHVQAEAAVQVLVEERLERERAQEVVRAKEARRRLRALATAGGVAVGGASAAAWVERQAESAWHFGPVRRR